MTVLHDRDVDVAIIGSGFGGLGLAIRLQRSGNESFVVLERESDVGGTWRDNTYPGVACDIPSHLYSFSFRQKPDWSRVFAPGAEIQEYLRESARAEGVLPHIRFNTEVLEASWRESSEDWLIKTAGDTVIAKTIVIATGRLSLPKLPDAADVSGYTGITFHSSQWDHGTELQGKRVGVVGTGASAAQLVPELAKQALELVVFQRSAAWIVPRNDREYSADEKRAFARDRDALERSREEYFWSAEEGFPQRIGMDARAHHALALALANLERNIPNEVLRAALTPHYEIGCKRILLSDDFYSTMMLGNVTLEPSAVVSADGGVVVSASGNEYELDALIFATGFESTRPPIAARVRGRGGRTLADHWAEGMTAFASTAVSGFPNLFIIDGPNASLGHNSAVYMIETQIGYILGALGYQRDHGGTVLEVSDRAEAAYTEELDEMSRSSVWLQGGCTSWYVDPRSNRLTLLWPDFAHAFRRRNGEFDPAPYGSSDEHAARPAALSRHR